MVPRAVLALGLLLITPLAAAQVGSPLRRVTIGQSMGGFGGFLSALDGFGTWVTSLGDLDGDGVTDVAVGVPGWSEGGPGRGAIWILFLNPDGTVKANPRISQLIGGFTGTLSDGGAFGVRIANVGDLDGDGVPELAVLSKRAPRLWIVFLRPDGSVKRHALNLFSDPAFVPPTRAGNFGFDLGMGGLEALGDLDGDGLGDLAVGSPYDPDGGVWTGAVWILRLRADGGLKAAHKLSELHGGFGGDLPVGGLFGAGIVHLGDLDGSGGSELGVASFVGGYWVLSLDASELVIGQRTSDTPVRSVLGDLDGDGTLEVDAGPIASLRPDGSVPRLLFEASFGGRLEPLGDLDGDGNPEVAIGLAQANAVEIVTLDSSALRNGSGVNPVSLVPAADPEPTVGTTWSLVLDCTAHAPGPAAVWGFSAPTQHPTPFGERLVRGTQYFQLRALHASGPTPFQLRVPPLIQLFGSRLYVQGACSGAPGAQFSNALDVVIRR